ARLPLGAPPSRARARTGVHGSDRATGDVGRLARARAEDLSGDALTRRRRDGVAEERVRRADPARERVAWADARRDGQIPRAVSPARPVAVTDAALAARDSDRGRAGRCGGHRVRLWRVAVDEPAAQAVRQRTARLDPRRRAARLLSSLAQPARSDGAWKSL